MSDRELLERAAKAAGKLIEFDDWSGKPVAFLYNDELVSAWNPLDDDGDAFRLQVALEMRVQTGVVWLDSVGYLDEGRLRIKQDPCAATRRAIVRAAAAMADRPAKSTPQEVFLPGTEGCFQDVEGRIPVTAIGQRVGFVQHRPENMPTFSPKPKDENDRP